MRRVLLRLAAIILSVTLLSGCVATDSSYAYGSYGYGYGPAYGGYYSPYPYGCGYGPWGPSFAFAPFFGFHHFHDHRFHHGFGGPHPFPGGGFHGHGHFGGGHFGGGHPGGFGRGGFGHGGFAGGHH